MAAKKSRHGATQTEDDRIAKAVLLRLRPSTTKKLDAYAKRLKVTRSAAVTFLIEGVTS